MMIRAKVCLALRESNSENRACHQGTGPAGALVFHQVSQAMPAYVYLRSRGASLTPQIAAPASKMFEITIIEPEN
jgi:hypothetical protein